MVARVAKIVADHDFSILTVIVDHQVNATILESHLTSKETEEIKQFKISRPRVSKQRILLPYVIEIERIAISIRTANELELYQKISDILSDTQ